MTVQQKATLTFSDGTAPIEFPVYKGTVGPDVIDIRKLYGQTGKFTYDPGFLSTASCNSTITYIDGDKGELLYRGYPIEQLAENCNFLEVAYLLKNGELPNASQKTGFENLDHQQQLAFEELVLMEDHDLWYLISGQTECHDPRLAPIVSLLRKS